MKDPDVTGFYWILTSSGWEVAAWAGEWWVVGREYSYSSKDLGLIKWEGPLVHE